MTVIQVRYKFSILVIPVIFMETYQCGYFLFRCHSRDCSPAKRNFVGGQELNISVIVLHYSHQHFNEELADIVKNLLTMPMGC